MILRVLIQRPREIPEAVWGVQCARLRSALPHRLLYDIVRNVLRVAFDELHPLTPFYPVVTSGQDGKSTGRESRRQGYHVGRLDLLPPMTSL